MTTDAPVRPKLKRGFAAMSPERRREISKLGGSSVPGEKRSFSRDRSLAAAAGRTGGSKSRSPKTETR